MSEESEPQFKRVLLKLSGESLMGDDAFGINKETLSQIVADIREVIDLGVEMGIVVGGGNIFRGVALGSTGMDRATGDYMGMLATMMNAMALQDAFRNTGVDARVQSAIKMDQVAEPYIRGKTLSHRHDGRIACSRNRRPDCFKGDERGRHLYRGSQKEPGSNALQGNYL